jgi:hypothetical protein
VKLVAMSRAPFPDLRFTIEIGPIVEGDIVCARWIGRGTYAGGLPATPAPAGTRVTFSGIDMLRVEKSKFVEYWVSSDGLHLMQQLGAGGGEGAVIAGIGSGARSGTGSGSGTGSPSGSASGSGPGTASPSGSASGPGSGTRSPSGSSDGSLR